MKSPENLRGERRARYPRITRTWLLGVGLLILAMLSSGLVRAEMAGWDAGPTAKYESAELTFPLQLAWSHKPTAVPQPAWPAPARGSYWQELERIEPRMVDDRTFVPVASVDSVWYGSSADDSVHCLELSSGKLTWRYTADGPIRFAPIIADDQVFFGSDDGQVYAVERKTGKLRWKKRLRDDQRILGNGRVISRWPIRSRLALADQTLYVSAGLFPSQGVDLLALAVSDGALRWRKQTNFPVNGELCITQDELWVPMGRGHRVAVDRHAGEIIGPLTGQAGTYAKQLGDWIVTGRGNDGMLSVSQRKSRQHLGLLPARHVAADQHHVYLLGRGKLTAIAHDTWENLMNEIVTHGGSLTQKLRRADFWKDQAHWQVACPHEAALIASQRAVIVGGEGHVAAYDSLTGQLVWETATAGRVESLTLETEHLLMTNDQGQLTCWKGGLSTLGEGTARTAERAKTTSLAGSPRRVSDAKGIPIRAEIPHDQVRFCLVCGLVDGDLAIQLARQTKWHIVAVDDDPDRVQKVRQQALEEGLYGFKLAVHHIASETLPFTSCWANIVISERDWQDEQPQALPWSQAELARVCRPYGGRLFLGSKVFTRGPLADAGQWTQLYANAGNTGNSGDAYIEGEPSLQWFGGPGPSRMVDRHLRSHAPLVSNGIMVVMAENRLLGVDAYQGTELWELTLPKSHRYSIPYDAGYASIDKTTLAIAVGKECWLVDIQSGQRLATHTLSQWYENWKEMIWSYTLLTPDQLLASVQPAVGVRLNPSRQLIDADYRNSTAVLASRALVASDRHTGALQWSYSEGWILNPTITVANGLVYFVDSRQAGFRARQEAGFRLSEFLDKDAYITALDLRTGRKVWELPLPEFLRASTNILYLQCTEDRLIACGSFPAGDQDTHYRIVAFQPSDGKLIWNAEHEADKRGEFTHGEQVHHPVIMGNLLIAEPVIYQLADGRRSDPSGNPKAWKIVRPGHSCGTLSASKSCLFFRANNPTMLDFTNPGPHGDRFFKLAPNRPGCWINIIPASGLILIPEASASCVCDYPLQTSMAFLSTSLANAAWLDEAKGDLP